VKRIYQSALPKGYLAAQPVAIQWDPSQEIVWPTKKNKVKKMKFSTEEFVEAVIKEVKKLHKIDGEKIFTLSWSSSGPAAYALALQDKTAVTGSFIAMSVFKPDYLPSLRKARGRGFYLFHSEKDAVCPYAHAEDANKKLEKEKAKVTLVTYEGGHGWHGNVYGNIRKGVDWLEKNHGKAMR
jgi:predicted esterase